MDDTCYHCGLPILPGVKFSAHVLGQDRPLCCLGCQAVAEAIVQNGLEDYYNFRTERPNTAEALIPEELRQLTLYDHPEVQKSFVFSAASTAKNKSETNLKQASLILEGVTCAACIWLNERHLKQLPGVREVAFNYGSHRARISWDDSEIKLSHILAEIRKIGYHAHPFSAQQQDAMRQQARKVELRRLAVAGISAAQVMMLGVALYAGMDIATEQFMRWFSLVMTIPAMLYSAWPFYQAAWRGVVNRRIGMDVPIVLGLFTGFAGSLWATLQGHGTVYYDTLTMLVFFLLATRLLERNAREKSVESAENLLRLVPVMAMRIDSQQQQTLVPLVEINAGDLIVSKPGETIAADGVVENGESSADESLLSGESRPLPKTIGSRVYAGSINYESPLVIRVTGVGENTMLASISRLLDRAQAEKPKLAMFADQVAAYFTYGLLVLVAVIGLVWWQLDISRCLEIVLTVLVVSCPCALSLAAPAAFAAAGSHLVKRGVLLTRGHALEALSHVTHVVFDKTGTLTIGRPVLLNTLAFAEIDVNECLKIATSLEQVSEHPLARSFIEAAKGQVLYTVESSNNTPGKGLSGRIDGRNYFLGNADLNPGVMQQCNLYAKDARLNVASGATIVWLSNDIQVLAAFELADKARPQAVLLVKNLREQQIDVSILSGDSTTAVAYFAEELDIKNWQASQSPEQKLSALKALQQQGEVVAMVGDGINDAPVLAGAQVSIAMGSGTQMARATGDVILLSENLLEIEHAIRISRFSIQVIRQNFAWALAYNMLALPFAAMGLLSPWMAAIGMSISSLVVVLNALRLR